MKMKRLLKDLYQEQKEKEPQVKVMDIIQLVLDLEDKVLEIKKKLKEIQPLVIPNDQPKKKGRPKGSKDTKKRKTTGYKGNKNAG